MCTKFIRYTHRGTVNQAKDDPGRQLDLDCAPRRQNDGRDEDARGRRRAGTVLVGDLILLEVLQGARDNGQAARIERALREYAVVPLLDDRLTVQAARNYRRLRDLGVTVRKTADVIIGTFCIEHGHALLHGDRDFEPMEMHLGLRTVRDS